MSSNATLPTIATLMHAIVHAMVQKVKRIGGSDSESSRKGENIICITAQAMTTD